MIFRIIVPEAWHSRFQVTENLKMTVTGYFIYQRKDGNKKLFYCMQTGDIAVGRSRMNIPMVMKVKVSAKGIEVMKTEPDGIGIV
jgi:hypothetical protein